MYRDNFRDKSFSRRVAVLAGGKAALFLLLAGRLYQLQVLESNRYRMLADENRINLRLLLPPRGRILDRHGTPIAFNRENYRAMLTAEKAEDPAGVRDIVGTLDALAQIIPISIKERERILREVRKRRSFVPVTIRENLDWNDVARIEVHAPDLPGITIDVGQSRVYPEAERLAHVLGYVAAVSEEELIDGGGVDPLLGLPDFRIGKDGIEKVYDLRLRGQAGNSQVEVNALGRVIQELEREEGLSGEDIRLTVDSHLQEVATQRLSDKKSAAAVVMDVRDGDILAMVSTPAFDPNEFAMGHSSGSWKTLVRDPLAPLTNKTISGTYSPGSTFKMIVALAALDAGIVGADHTVTCYGSTTLGNAKFHCWKKYGHGKLDMIGGLRRSCDVYFYDVARKVGIDRIAAMARRFGFGEALGIDLPGERDGLVPTREWKRAVTGVPWQQGETLIVGIGQGFLLSTPLQLAVMASRIANGGRAVKPRLMRSADGADDAIKAVAFPEIGVSDAALRIVRMGMEQVVNSPRGTAFRSRIRDKGMEMAGKTGTSQVRRISKRERETRVLKNEERPWRERDHALFVGFAPLRNPRYAAAVIVEHGGSGSKAAAPVARDLLHEAQKRAKELVAGDGKVAAALGEEDPS